LRIRKSGERILLLPTRTGTFQVREITIKKSLRIRKSGERILLIPLKTKSNAMFRNISKHGIVFLQDDLLQ
jgi:hypothetical protein